jgi:beta-lactamase regulating signal transducer with metallopeptidase domain
LETWHVTPHAASHQISILGQKLSYPAANLGAVAVLILAIVGLVVVGAAALGASREVLAARRFSRRMATETSRLSNGALVFEDPRPRAFCAGLLRPHVYVSTGAVALLDEPALDAVLEHERHHADRRDPLRLASARVMARALFFLPGYQALVDRQRRLAELGADEHAMIAAPGSRSALARAMVAFSDSSNAGEETGIDLARVDHLLGETPAWRFPAAIFVLAALVIALIVAVVVLVGQTAFGAATLSPPFLSRQACVVVLALIPAALGLGSILVARTVRSR